MKFENINTPSASGGEKKFYSDYDEFLTYHDETNTHKWAISWSDLMMTMFVMFAVMYIYQFGDKDLRFGSGPGMNHFSEQGSNMVVNIDPRVRPLDIYDQTKQAVHEVLVDQKTPVDLVSDGTVRIVLAGDLFFDPGRAELKIGARYQLDQIARVLNENEFAINIAGHTDDTPSGSKKYPTNWELSSKRAVMVARYLTEVRKVDQNRIFITAHSFHQPLKPNDTSYNRALNRRVEIILMKRKPYIQ